MGSAHSNIMHHVHLYSLRFKLIRIAAGMHHLVDSYASLHQTQNDKNDENYHNESNYHNNNNNDCREREVMTINDSYEKLERNHKKKLSACIYVLTYLKAMEMEMDIS